VEDPHRVLSPYVATATRRVARGCKNRHHPTQILDCNIEPL